MARAELPEDAMPLEFMQDRRLDFVDYSKLKPFTVSIYVQHIVLSTFFPYSLVKNVTSKLASLLLSRFENVKNLRLAR